MSASRERCEVVGPSRELGRTIERLRADGFRRVDAEPRRIGQYATRPVDPRAHIHLLVWLQVRAPRRRQEALA